MTRVPSTIHCSELRLIGHDHEPPIFAGPGHIDIRSTTSIDFTMFASQSSGHSGARHFQCRLFATDYDGIEWACGWTHPWVRLLNHPITGEIDGLTTAVKEKWVASGSGVELILPKLELPMEQQLVSVSSFDNEEFQREVRPGRQTLRALGSEITFFYTPADDALWVTARTSEKLLHPYAENWLTEPLRILMGQLIYPRLVARNFGDGSAFVSLRSSPSSLKHTALAALLDVDPMIAGPRFWKLYADLLTMIGEAGDSEGNPKFETHRVTRFYEEMIQATQGSRWVVSMTFASTAEGLAKMLMGPKEQKSHFTEEDLRSLKEHVEQWKQNEELRSRVLGEVGRAGKKTIGRYLWDLVREKVLEEKHATAWSDVRNAVMHGELTSPWSSEEEDRRLLDLADLVHRLTRKLMLESCR